jgi:hypothetical protein
MKGSGFTWFGQMKNSVMAGPDPAIHVLPTSALAKTPAVAGAGVDARVKPAHDEIVFGNVKFCHGRA